MDEDWPDDVETCLLERTDGSEWVVSDMILEGADVRVTARRRGGPESGDGGRLVDETLDRGDVLRWLDDTGTVIWTMRHLGLGAGRPGADGADAVLGLGHGRDDREARGSPGAPNA